MRQAFEEGLTLPEYLLRHAIEFRLELIHQLVHCNRKLLGSMIFYLKLQYNQLALFDTMASHQGTGRVNKPDGNERRTSVWVSTGVVACLESRSGLAIVSSLNGIIRAVEGSELELSSVAEEKSRCLQWSMRYQARRTAKRAIDKIRLKLEQ